MGKEDLRFPLAAVELRPMLICAHTLCLWTSTATTSHRPHPHTPNQKEDGDTMRTVLGGSR